MIILIEKFLNKKIYLFIQEGVDLCAVTGKNYVVVIPIWENNETDIFCRDLAEPAASAKGSVAIIY